MNKFEEKMGSNDRAYDQRHEKLLNYIYKNELIKKGGRERARLG